jgi:hypothetical protein
MHLAVKLLDRTFSACRESDINAKSYDLIANGCLLLAAKFEELDMNVPLIIDLQIANKFKMSYDMLKGIESELLTILDFDLMALTPHHFLT